MGPGWPSRAPAGGVRGQPAQAEARPDPALPVPPAGSEGAHSRLHRRPRRTPGRGQDPAYRGLQRYRTAAPRNAEIDTGRVGAKPLQPRGPVLGVDGRRLRLGVDRLAAVPPVLTAARRLGAEPRQVALAWLLGRSSQILPIPGSGSPEHVAANVAAASLELTPDESDAILQLAQ